MIIGVGVDICSLTRIEFIIKKYEKRFLQRIAHAKEQDIYFTIGKNKKDNNKNHKQIRYLGKLFAMKEALAKASGQGIGKAIKFNEIMVSNNKKGQPFIELYGRSKLTLSKMAKLYKINCSLSYEMETVVAFVVISNQLS